MANQTQLLSTFFLIFLCNFPFTTTAAMANDQTSCSMCSSCDNPCQPQPPPPPPPTPYPPPPSPTSVCPPPPSPTCDTCIYPSPPPPPTCDACAYPSPPPPPPAHTYPPTGGGGGDGGSYSPPGNGQFPGIAPPPPNPIMPYFPFYYIYSPPSASSVKYSPLFSGKILGLAFFVILFRYW